MPQTYWINGRRGPHNHVSRVLSLWSAVAYPDRSGGGEGTGGWVSCMKSTVVAHLAANQRTISVDDVLYASQGDSALPFDHVEMLTCTV